MISKFLTWIKDPARYRWLKNPFKVTLLGVIIVGICTGIYLFRQGYSADTLGSPPKINDFSGPTYSARGVDFLLNVNVTGVENIQTNVAKTRYACIVTSGTGANYYIQAGTSGNITTKISRNLFKDGSGLRSMHTAPEILTLNCANSYGAVRKSLAVNMSVTDLPPVINIQAPTFVTTSQPFNVSWSTSKANKCTLTSLTTGDNLTPAIGNTYTYGSYTFSKGITSAIFIGGRCSNSQYSGNTVDTGLVIFVKPIPSSWKITFNPPTTVNPDTSLEVNYSVRNESGQIQRTAYCWASGAWSGTLDMLIGKRTIPGWTSGSKVFTITCQDWNYRTVSVSKTISAIKPVTATPSANLTPTANLPTQSMSSPSLPALSCLVDPRPLQSALDRVKNSIQPDFSVDTSSLPTEFLKYQIAKLNDYCGSQLINPLARSQCQTTLQGYVNDAIFYKIFGSSGSSFMNMVNTMGSAQMQQQLIQQIMNIPNQNHTLATAETVLTSFLPKQNGFSGAISTNSIGVKYNYTGNIQLQPDFFKLRAGIASCDLVKRKELRGESPFTLFVSMTVRVNANNYYLTYTKSNNVISAAYNTSF